MVHLEYGVGQMSFTKIAFVLLAVAFLMPTPPESLTGPKLATFETEPSKSDLVGAASDALGDLTGFCGRQPGVCETAGYLLHKFEAKAKYSVRLLYEWANQDEAMGASLPYPHRDEARADPLATGSTIQAVDRAGSQNTLTLEDLIPEWRGPGAVKRG